MSTFIARIPPGGILFVMVSKRLYRSRQDRIIAGIFGGLGEYFDVDSVVLRLAWIVLLVVTGFIPGILIYLIAVFIVPNEPIKEDEVVHEMPASKSDTNASNTTTSAW